MKINQIIESTTSGSVATVAKPLGSTQSRNPSIYPGKTGNLLKGKTKKGPYQNSLTEGKVKELAMDLSGKDRLSDENFKKKYGKTKQEMSKLLQQKYKNTQKDKVGEAKLDEEDIIIVPGKQIKRGTGFIPRGKSRIDHEVEMARSDVLATMKNAKAIYLMLKNRTEDDGIEGWVQEKLIKANDYLNSVKEYYDEKMMPEGLAGATIGGIAGAAITKTPSGAIMGAELGSDIQDRFTNENGGVIAGGVAFESKVKKPKQVNEKFASQQQAKLMYAAAGDKDVSKKTGVSQKVAKEFIKKSHGQKVSNLPKKVKKD